LLPTAAAAVKLMPEIADLSRYILTIPGLPAGQYRVAMDDKPVATLSNQELANGWNMSTVVEGPLGERAVKILDLINQLQNPLNIAWRDASKEKNPAKLAAAQKAIDEGEASVEAACQPAPIRFTVEPAK
jgi:beta-mannanase